MATKKPTTRKNPSAKRTQATERPTLTGDVLRKALEDAAAMEKPERDAQRRAKNRPVQKAIVDRGRWRMDQALQIIASLRRLTVTIVGSDPSDDEFHALALATDHLAMLAMHRLNQASATFGDSFPLDAEAVRDWIGPFADDIARKQKAAETEAANG